MEYTEEEREVLEKDLLKIIKGKSKEELKAIAEHIKSHFEEYESKYTEEEREAMARISMDKRMEEKRKNGE